MGGQLHLVKTGRVRMRCSMEIIATIMDFIATGPFNPTVRVFYWEGDSVKAMDWPEDVTYAGTNGDMLRMLDEIVLEWETMAFKGTRDVTLEWTMPHSIVPLEEDPEA